MSLSLDSCRQFLLLREFDTFSLHFLFIAITPNFDEFLFNRIDSKQCSSHTLTFLSKLKSTFRGYQKFLNNVVSLSFTFKSEEFQSSLKNIFKSLRKISFVRSFHKLWRNIILPQCSVGSWFLPNELLRYVATAPGTWQTSLHLSGTVPHASQQPGPNTPACCQSKYPHSGTAQVSPVPLVAFSVLKKSQNFDNSNCSLTRTEINSNFNGNWVNLYHLKL